MAFQTKLSNVDRLEAEIARLESQNKNLANQIDELLRLKNDIELNYESHMESMNRKLKESEKEKKDFELMFNRNERDSDEAVLKLNHQIKNLQSENRNKEKQLQDINRAAEEMESKIQEMNIVIQELAQ